MDIDPLESANDAADESPASRDRDRAHVATQVALTVALLSLGATRRMTIRAKNPPRQTIHVDLEPGSLLVMTYATQLHFTHGVPKTTEQVGERVSLAFRVKPASRPSADGVSADFYR